MTGYDVVALGELLIDFTQNGMSAQGNPIYEANPGGAPCNVLAMLQKLGRRTAFIGKVGADGFGLQLKNALEETGISSQGLRFDQRIPTTLAVVGRKPDGDRDFSFYRKPGADIMLRKEELPEELLGSAKIFHFGSLSLTDSPSREAAKEAVRLAKESGALISFDPNLRLPLWDTEKEARKQILYGLSQCQILKIADNELEWLTGKADHEAAAREILSEFAIPLVFVSLGKAGSMAFCGEKMVRVKAFVQENPVDTTGAGDTFMGCILHQVLEKGSLKLTDGELEQMLRFANGAASLVTMRRGALRVMPNREEINTCLKAVTANK